MVLFIDMNTFYPHSRALRYLDVVLRIALVALAFITAFALVVIAISLSGRGSWSAASHLDGSYRIEFDDGRAIGIDNGSATTYENFDQAAEHATLTGPVELVAQVSVPTEDRDSRVVLGLLLVGWLGAAWLGLWNLRAVVAATRGGDPFAQENGARLRRLGIAVLSVPVMTWIGGQALEATFNPDLPFVADVGGGVPAWLMAVVGLGVLALAEVFAEGTRLREFEESTV